MRDASLFEPTALNMPENTLAKIIDREIRYGATNYAPLPVVLSHGLGAEVWDISGKRYIDMMSSYSAVSHGHSHPRLVNCLISQAQRLAISGRTVYNDKLGALLQRICALTGMDRALPMTTGVEAVETAIKAARKWAYNVKQVPSGQAEILVCAGNFHGRTTTVVGMSSKLQYQSGFGPFCGGFKIVPYGDIDALAAAITPSTAAFLVEPIQGERGIFLPPVGYLKQAAELCSKNKVLLIFDEIQTGLGRTGRFLAAEHEQIKPDALILGKALGGGLLPISLFLSKKEIMDVFQPGDHGSTFGGNPLAAAVALETLDVLFEENLIQRSEALGSYLRQELLKLKAPSIKEVRGKGLFIGLEFIEGTNVREICLKLLETGVLSYDTHGTIIRLVPPLVITKEQLDEVLAKFSNVLLGE